VHYCITCEDHCWDCSTLNWSTV